jgi:hypothetical protein
MHCLSFVDLINTPHLGGAELMLGISSASPRLTDSHLRSTICHHKYTLPPDDGLLIRQKHVEVR